MAAREENTDLTQCPVCFEPYTETGDYIPRILPCYCTLCQSCILKLIKNEQLECPQDRKRHLARQEERSFPQNKYILSYLTKEFQPKETDYDVCPEHKMKLVLFCKDEKCEKAICPVCMSENHLSHEVVNILKEEKQQLGAQLDSLLSTLGLHSAELQRAKQQIAEDCERKIKKLTERKEEVMAELDEKLSSCQDNVATLSDIREKIEKGSTHQELRDKLEFVNVMKDLCAEAKEPVKVTFYELTETELEIEKAEEKEENIVQDDLEEKTEKIGKKKPYLTGDATEICKVQCCIIEALEVLSDGSVATVYNRTDRGTYCLKRYDRDTGEVLYSTKLKNWAGGMVEVNLGGKPTLVLSYKAVTDSRGNISSPATLKFFEVPHLNKCIHTMQTDGVEIEKMCRSLKGSAVLGQVLGNRKQIYTIDCTEAPPKYAGTVVLSGDTNLFEMCVTRDFKDNVIVVCVYNVLDSLFAEDMRGNVIWSVEGAISGKHPIDCRSVTCDQRGHIFVCDKNNNCIEMFTTDGLYLGTLVSKGERGIGEPYRVRWCEKTSSLVVAHRGSKNYNSWSVTALKIRYH